MTLTIYSVITAILWFDLFVLLGVLLQRKLCLFMNYNLFPILFLIVLSLIRLFAPVETPLTVVIRSWIIAPAIQNTLRTEVNLGGSISLHVFQLVVFASTSVSIMLLAKLVKVYRKEYSTVEGFEQADDARLFRLMDEIVQRTGQNRPYRICVVNQSISPSICGLLHPLIILPEDILSLTDQEIRYIFMHEWQHHLQKDLWAKLFIETICCLMWWNPVVYLLKKDIDQTFELKCDLITTSQLSENDKLNYLDTLLKVARMQLQGAQRKTESSVAFAIHFTGASAKYATNARQRFQTIIKYNQRNRKLGAVCMICMLLLFLLSFRFVVQPYYAPPMNDLVEQENPNIDWTSVVTPTPENAYIIETEDGVYLLYINNKFFRILSTSEICNETHKNIPIIKAEKG